MFFVWFIGLAVVVSGDTGSSVLNTSKAVFPTPTTFASLDTSMNTTEVNFTEPLSSKNTSMTSNVFTITNMTVVRGISTVATASVTSMNITPGPSVILSSIHQSLRSSTSLISVPPFSKTATERLTSTSTVAATSVTSTSITPGLTAIASSTHQSLASSTLSISVTTTSKTAMETLTTTTSETSTNKSKSSLFGMDGEVAEHVFIAAICVGVVGLLSSIIVCCCCNCEVKKLKKRFSQRDATITANRHCEDGMNNGELRSFPSPLQFQTFSQRKKDSPYDIPDQQETELSYVTVVDGDYDVEPQYTNAKNITQDEVDEQQSPSPPHYYNTSAFTLVDFDPYQELNPNERDEEPHYTSLIGKKQENELDV